MFNERGPTLPGARPDSVGLPRVVVIVLHWKGLADTLACLDSLSRLAYPACEVVVVDNGSTDGAATAIRAAFPWCTVIQNEENLGFAEGNNVGLCYAGQQAADYALLLNNDTEVDPEFMNHLIAAIDSDPAVGVVGPTIYYHERPDVIWSAGGQIDWRRGTAGMVGMDGKENGQYCVREVDFVTGCALLVRMAALKRTGTLDARFFAYYEEAEWCVRIQRAGYRILHVPQARIWHKIPPGDGRAASPTVHYYITRNRILFLMATGAGLRPWVYTLLFDYSRTLIAWTLRPRWRGKRAQRAAMLQALGDAWRGRWGKQPSQRRA